MVLHESFTTFTGMRAWDVRARPVVSTPRIACQSNYDDVAPPRIMDNATTALPSGKSALLKFAGGGGGLQCVSPNEFRDRLPEAWGRITLTMASPWRTRLRLLTDGEREV
jgi:hypothetical protein